MRLTTETDGRTNALVIRLLGAMAACSIAAGANAATITYDLNTDWSDASNPNGVWAYADGGGAITTHITDYNTGDFGLGQPAWALAASGPGHIVSWFKSTKTFEDFLPGDVVTHSWDSASSGASTADSNVVWTSPSAGTIDISGSVWQARDRFGRSVDWSLAINGLAVTGGSLTSVDPYNRASPFSLLTGSGGAGVLTAVPVLVGDTVVLSFITTSSFGEYVGVNFTIDLTESATPVPEPATLLLLGTGLAAAGLRRRHREAGRRG